MSVACWARLLHRLRKHGVRTNGRPVVSITVKQIPNFLGLGGSDGRNLGARQWRRYHVKKARLLLATGYFGTSEWHESIREGSMGSYRHIV
jgi:predicted alpha/beta hydrolase